MTGLLFLALIIVGAAFTVFFLVKENDKGIQNSYFLAKYSKLIALLTDNRKSDIHKVRTSSVSIRVNMNKDNHFFVISEVDERLIIVWKLHSNDFGKRGKEWSFNPAYDQAKMYGEILSDIRSYQASLKEEKSKLGNTRLSAV